MIKFMYLCDPTEPRRILTIARKIVITQSGQKQMEMGYSICSPSDQFCKAKGRQIALGRLEKTPIEAERDLGPDESPIMYALENVKESCDIDIRNMQRKPGYHKGERRLQKISDIIKAKLDSQK